MKMTKIVATENISFRNGHILHNNRCRYIEVITVMEIVRRGNLEKLGNVSLHRLLIRVCLNKNAHKVAKTKDKKLKDQYCGSTLRHFVSSLN